MKTISATEAKQNFAAVLDDVRQGPVLIRRHERDAAVMMSSAAYEDYRKLKVDRVMRICDEISDYAATQGMNEEVLAQLLAGDDVDLARGEEDSEAHRQRKSKGLTRSRERVSDNSASKGMNRQVPGELLAEDDVA